LEQYGNYVKLQNMLIEYCLIGIVWRELCGVFLCSFFGSDLRECIGLLLTDITSKM
jgi:hypothetical protein